MKPNLVQLDAVRKALEGLIGKREARIALQAAPQGQASVGVLRVEKAFWF